MSGDGGEGKPFNDGIGGEWTWWGWCWYWFTKYIQWRVTLEGAVPCVRYDVSNPKQLKHMLCNYAVANGYQLRFKKNDSKRLLGKNFL